MGPSSFVPLADFAATFGDRAERPAWAPPDSGPPAPLDHLAVRGRIEDVLDTVVALQRADWLQDGVYVGPRGHADVYRDVLHCARVLGATVPPAILTSGVMRSQQAAGSDARPFLVLSSFFCQTASEAERRFVIGRLIGHIALRHVTATSLYAVVVDQAGMRQVARRAVGPLLEVVLAPIGLGMRLALSRWHRAAELAADRAGLLCSGSVDDARKALLRIALAGTPEIDAEAYMDQLRDAGEGGSPGKWAELLASEPWMHKRMQHLEWFGRSRRYAQLRGLAEAGGIDDEELERRTADLLRVG